jgi:hypothetical protein
MATEMEPLRVNSDLDSQSPACYVWEVPGKQVSIHLPYDVVDRLLMEVMRGFGSVPRRGAEVGGLLLGSSELTDRLTVRIEDYDPVPCSYMSGPSYVLSERDLHEFADSYDRWRNGPDRRIYALGYYRSHTRDGLSLMPEDMSLMKKYLPPPKSVALLIKPFATKVSIAGFFFWEDGTMQTESTYLEFPFRRKELGGGVTGVERSAAARPSESRADAVREPGLVSTADDADQASIAERPPVVPKPEGFARKGWVWIPLSFIFLFLGVLLGFQAALSVQKKTSSDSMLDPYSLVLSVTKSGDTLNIRWDRQAPAIRGAQRGELLITDGSYRRQLDLDASQLQIGSVIYRRVSENVTFRLEVFTRDRTSVVETWEYKEGAVESK